MKETLNTSEIADRLFRDENAGFTYAGARALAEYLDTDENADAEFDRVAIRCDYSEHESLADWADEYFGKASDWRVGKLGIPAADYDTERESESIREYIRDNGQLIEFEGGVIVSQF
jgi:hypothetical protein